ncbi:LIM and SH3 domain protein F42H10.3-like isoform X3 [Biomphalaria glabrata]|uniref:LIM and SH3 domain protein F42H10.3-like isoform X3 n=1 Tax=Biomphalaria glabrata TaxID=6526 RepID=A0A9W2YAD5_BIOGL|nr:LIM and SH3 domain protein F42H10.3-like isoform X3 [Biomphalaria glabrata]
MSKKCAKCLKTVYPTEELKCLDKIWHKLCFKCEVCGMTLNMKNYKGFEKLPYCSAHYPTTKPTAVADTPEARRIAENTKIQSNVQYHADFEKQKGFKTSVADDPETSRIKQNTQIQSNVNYWGLKEQREQMEGRRPQEALDDGEPRISVQKGSGRPSPGGHQPFSYGGNAGAPPPMGGHSQNRSSYEDDGYAQRAQQQSQQPYSYAQVHGQRVQPGSIADYDPLNQHHSSVVRNSYGQSQPQAYQPAPPQAQPPRAAQAAPKQVIYRALYDYSAADNDEVSFMDGDHIVNVEVVDAGWMIGTVQRTGQHGMLPSNYVERIN